MPKLTCEPASEMNSDWLEPGIYRLTTCFPLIKTNQAGKKYLSVEFVADNGKKSSCNFGTSNKALPFLARYAQHLGISATERESIDTDAPNTFAPLADKVCWGMVEWNLNKKTGKSYGQVTRTAPDGEKPNWPEPAKEKPVGNQPSPSDNVEFETTDDDGFDWGAGQ